MTSKFYVVWQGRNPGIYDSWSDCKAQVDNYKHPRYKKFDSMEAAQQAYEKGCDYHYRTYQTQSGNKVKVPLFQQDSFLVNCVMDGQKMTYYAIYLKTNQRIFSKTFERGTQRIGQFLAVVKSLVLLQKRTGSPGDPDIPIYTESLEIIDAIHHKYFVSSYLRKTSRDPFYQDLIVAVNKAVKLMQERDFKTPILHWNKSYWGELPKR